MTVPTIKLNLASFDYYVMKVSSNATSEEVAKKLSGLRKMDQFGRYLALEINENSTTESQTILVKEIAAIAEKCMFEVKFILANKFVTEKIIAAIPVVELSLNLKSPQIANPALRLSDPVRSGIKIENDGDIIIMNLVSNNAEIIASGSIHAYGEVRGRLIAGCFGNKDARIFVQKFNPELISIAGIYRTLDEKLPVNILNKPVQVFLDDKDRLNVVAL